MSWRLLQRPAELLDWESSAAGQPILDGLLRAMHRYQITIFWSDEDRVFVADIPELPVCMTHGDSHESALAEAQNAISYWLEAAARIGRPIPQPAGGLVVPNS